MAEKTQKCGGKTIRYPGECTYSCVCPGGSSVCTYTVTCGDTTFSGTGLTMGSDRANHPHVTLDGNLLVLSKILQEAWKRRVTVPADLRDKRVRSRTAEGTPEEIANAFGLKLGPAITGAKARGGKRVSIE